MSDSLSFLQHFFFKWLVFIFNLNVKICNVYGFRFVGSFMQFQKMLKIIRIGSVLSNHGIIVFIQFSMESEKWSNFDVLISGLKI